MQRYTFANTHIDKNVLGNNIPNVSKAFFTTHSPIYLSLKVSVVWPPPVYQTFNPLFYSHVSYIS